MNRTFTDLVAMAPKVKGGIPVEDREVERLGERGRGRSELTGEDFMFLLGLGLFILFLVLAHPSTPGFTHQSLIFWMSVTMLFLSMAPDYVNVEMAKEWLEEYKGSRVEGFYRRIYNAARNGDEYFSSGNFFVAGVLLTILAVFLLFYTGEIKGFVFGISYGAFMRAILV